MGEWQRLLRQEKRLPPSLSASGGRWWVKSFPRLCPARRARPFSLGPPIPEVPQPRGRQQVPPPHTRLPGARQRGPPRPLGGARGRCQRPQRSAWGLVAISPLPRSREGTPSPSMRGVGVVASMNGGLVLQLFDVG